MIVTWWIFWISLAVLVTAAAALRFGGDKAEPAAIAVGITALVSACIFGIGGLVISLQRHYGRVSCRTFAAQTARKTRFVVYTGWSGGDCLTPDGNGHWIPTKSLREFGSKP